MNKAKSGSKSPLEKYLEGKVTQRLSELDGNERNTMQLPNIIEMPSMQPLPDNDNSID